MMITRRGDAAGRERERALSKYRKKNQLSPRLSSENILLQRGGCVRRYFCDEIYVRGIISRRPDKSLCVRVYSEAHKIRREI